MGQYVNYGCGLTAPSEWINFDVSPTLRLQKMPLVGSVLKSLGLLNTNFPANVRYGNVVQGLPGIASNSCDGVFCSHVLEHLALEDFYKALRESYRVLKPGGTFRLVLPNLQKYMEEYQQALQTDDPQASVRFMQHTIVGTEYRAKGLKAIVEGIWGNARHLWMWDPVSMQHALREAGFSSVRPAIFQDSKDSMFELVEEKSRFDGAMAFEAQK